MRSFAPHALRHRYASMLSMAGVQTRIMQEVLGHSKGSITHDTYSHVLLVGEPPERLRALRRGVLVVSSGGMMLAANDDLPANRPLDEGMGSTGIEPVTSRV